MSKKPISIILPVLAAIALGTLFSFTLRHYFPAQNQGSRSNASTQALYAANLPDAQGKPQALQQWQGKVAVVNFWATWCPPCREEMPELSELYNQYKDQGVVVIGISTDELPKMQAFAAKSPVSYPLLAGNEQAMVLSEQLGNNKGALPYTVIVRADGSIANTYFGRISADLLKTTLLPLLGK